jgi:PAS domain S-box-containing protein
MAKDDEFASTMRIDITPDVLKELGQSAPKVDTKRVRQRSPVVRVPKGQGKSAAVSKYDQLLQSIYDAAIVTDLEGRITDVNARALEFFLYSREELKGLTVQDVIAGADQDLLRALRQNLQNKRFALIQAYCARKDRSLFPAEIAVNILRFQELRMAFFVRDITLRRQAEEMLRTEHSAIQNSANGIAISDTEGMLEYVNPATVRLWGYNDPEELMGRDVSDLWKDKAAARTLVQRVLESGETQSAELVAVKKGGRDFHVQISVGCNRDADDEVVGMVFSFMDISDRKRAEDATRQAEQQRVMLASLGAACHHLGQPATVLLTNLEMMEKFSANVPDDFRELITSSVEAAELIAELLHKLNTVAEYRTTEYIEDSHDPDAPTNRILKI